MSSMRKLEGAQKRLQGVLDKIPYIVPPSVAKEDLNYASVTKGVTGTGIGIPHPGKKGLALHVNVMTAEDQDRISRWIGDTFEGHDIVYSVTGVIRAL